MKPSDVKANVKLLPGTYWYIKVGSRYYGGQEVDKETVELSGRPPILGFFNKDQSHRPGYAAHHYREYHTGWWSRGNRSARDRRKGSEANYRKPLPPIKKKTVVQYTGQSTPRLVDTPEKAKRFRRKEQVESACSMLQTLYGSVGAEVSVHYKGVSK